MSAGTATRVIAAKIIDRVLYQGESLKSALAAELPAVADHRDRALIEAICFSAIRQHRRVEHALLQWMQKQLPRKDNPLRALLHVGFAQLTAMQLPAHAAVSATVDAVRVLGYPHQAKLVNALLRRAQREGLPELTMQQTWPGWFLKQIQADWPEHWQQILEQSMLPAPLWLRVNRQQVKRDALQSRWNTEGIESIADEHAEDALRLVHTQPITQLPGFNDGDASVQDLAAQRVVDLFSLHEGARVLDACAAPGGKSAHLLERYPHSDLTALDIDPTRVERIRQNLQRLQLQDQAKLLAADAADISQWWDGVPFDAVLLDAPCSATGIIRRQPDVLVHRRAADIGNLVELQQQLMDALWKTVVPGGVLVYTTCSILKAENSEQITAFLQRQSDAQAESLAEDIGHDVLVGRQNLPGEQQADGFFYARLRKQRT